MSGGGAARESSPEDLRFADLVRLREAQQEKRIEHLIAQNHVLQQKVADAVAQQRAFVQQVSGTGAQTAQTNGTVGHHDQGGATTTAPPTASADDAPPAAADRRDSSAAASATSAVAPAVIHVVQQQHVDVEAILQRAKVMVQEHVDAAITAERNTQQAQSSRLEQRFAEVQGGLAEVVGSLKEAQQSRDLIRQEHTSQHLLLCGEIDALRDENTALTDRMAARDATIMALQGALRTSNQQVEKLEGRLTEMESLPSALRQQTADWDDKIARALASIEEDRSAAHRAKTEAEARNEASLTAAVEDARATLLCVQMTAKELTDQLKAAQESVQQQVKENVAAVAQQLETEIVSKLDEQNERLQQMQQRLVLEQQSASQAQSQALADMKHSVDSSLMGMRRQYHDALQEQLRAVVQQQQEFEEKRRAECPVADADRIDLMVKELQGACAVIDVLAHRAAQSPEVTELIAKIASLEQRVDLTSASFQGLATLVEKTSAAAEAPRLAFTIGIQADTDGQGALWLAGRERQTTLARINQNFRDEMDKADDALQEHEAAKAIAGKTASPLGAAVAVPPAGSSRPLFHPVASPPSPPRNKPAAATSGAQLRTVQDKEAALEKIQGVLRSIQLKFHQLTEAEARVAATAGHVPVTGGSRSTSAQQQQAHDTRKVSEEIARQKAAVYQQERLLVEQRNALWRDIEQLRRQEMLQ